MHTSILDYIGSAVTYIEENLKNEISLEKISKELFLSKFHLNRIFSAITGRTLMHYISSRKLVSSLNELLHTDMRIVDIAYEYGFRFEQSFIRAFKREFGITPDSFRKTRCELKVTAKIHMDSLTAITEKSTLMEPVVIVKPCFEAIGARCYVDQTAYIETSYLTEFANAFYDKKLPLIENITDRQVYYGHCLHDGEYTHYTSCVEVRKGEEPPEGLVKIVIPANQYWVFKYVGLHGPREITFMDFIHIDEAVAKRMAATGRPYPTEYHFEKIDLRNCTESYCELDLYYPIT